jgi:hypothetical protein
MKPEIRMTERNIKTLLVQHLREIGEAKGAKVLSELCVAGFTRRADVVLVNGKLSAYEIKGEFDTLDRLVGQVETFSKYFESLTVVCAPRHTNKVLSMTPADIGVWEVADNQINVKRSAAVGLNQGIDVWLSYLPVRLLKPFLIEHGVSTTGRNRSDLVDAAKVVPVSLIRQAALDYLRSRGLAPAGFRPCVNKVMVRNDPVRQNDFRVLEYISLMTASGDTLRAVPRLVRK